MIEELDDIFTRTLSYTRTLMAELSPPVLHELGLPSALKWLADQAPKQYNLTVEVALTQDQVALPEDQALLLYESVRELAQCSEACPHVRGRGLAYSSKR